MDKSDQATNDRPRREATLVTDYKSYHTTGHVAAAVKKIETPQKEDRETTLSTTPTAGSKVKRNLSGTNPGSTSEQHVISPELILEETQPQAGAQPQPANTETTDHRPAQTAMSEIEKLRQELEEQKALNQQMQEELEAATLRADLEREKQKNIEWQAARDKLTRKTEQQRLEHKQTLKTLQDMENKAPTDENHAIKFLKEKLAELTGETTPSQVPPEPDATTRKQQEIADQLKELKKRQIEISQAAATAVKGHEDNPLIKGLLAQIATTNEQKADTPPIDEQHRIMEDLLMTMQGKKPEAKVNHHKEILKQFLVDSNKVTTTGGATTLKPDLLKKLTGESDSFLIHEWLAKYNKCDSEESKCDMCSDSCQKHKKSGMLDKATANIQHKEIWPQKNLIEDWADEEIDFKHMQFEHYVAGEVRTIETCTEPAQILGRMKLLRRIAYAKLRGYDWALVRKMYAAILRSIETGEHSWEDNFDRYENILYRKPPTKPAERDRPNTANNPNSNKKWFCRDWNKGNCTKTSPHKSWFGSGTNATQRTVLHMCATCYMKDKSQKDHPENHETCPHREA